MRGAVRGWTTVAAACLAALGAGCGVGGEGGNPPPEVCSTSKAWTSGDRESPEMHPGDDCIGCHSSGEGPRFLIAGTVMNDLKDDTNCYGVEGVTVQITDANGKVNELTTNAAGNFYLESRGGSLATPFTAKVLRGGKEKAMTAAQSNGACATCHTAGGANGAPGRILPPT